MKYTGWLGYCVRECVNETRCWLLDRGDNVNNLLFAIIDWLDKKPSVAEWRKRDRGI